MTHLELFLKMKNEKRYYLVMEHCIMTNWVSIGQSMTHTGDWVNCFTNMVDAQSRIKILKNMDEKSGVHKEYNVLDLAPYMDNIPNGYI